MHGVGCQFHYIWSFTFCVLFSTNNASVILCIIIIAIQAHCYGEVNQQALNRMTYIWHILYVVVSYRNIPFIQDTFIKKIITEIIRSSLRPRRSKLNLYLLVA